MTADPRDQVSEISETTGYSGNAGFVHFSFAVGWGLVAGTVAIVVLSIVQGMVAPYNLLGIIGLALFYGLFVGLFTLAGMLVVGLPTTLLLKAIRCENAILYALLGAFVAAPLLYLLIDGDLGRIFDFDEEVWIPSTLAGSTSAYRWGRWRQSLSKVAKVRKAQNPFHDMIH